MAVKLPQYVISALKKGIKLHRAGHSGDGLVSATVAMATRGINSGTWPEQKIGLAAAWFARHEADRERMREPSKWDNPPAYSPAYVAWLLWGSDSDDRGRRWIVKTSKRLEEMSRHSGTPAPKKDQIRGGANTGRAAGKSREKIQISDAANEALRKKASDHNEAHGDKQGRRVTLRMLQKVFLRGLGAYSTSHRPAVTSRAQWAHARVNAFLRLVRVGKPQNARYITDNDLLPAGHPRAGD